MSNYKFDSSQHVHTLNDKPLTGTSKAVGVISKPGLVWWSSGMAVGVMGWTPNKDKDKKWISVEKRLEITTPIFEEVKALTPKQYLERLDEGYHAHAKQLKKSAGDGTDLHALAEEWVKAQIEGKEIETHPQLQPLVSWAKKNVKKWLWSEMHCYSEVHWVGGISDAGFEDMEGRIAIMDFKSSKEAYDGHFIQCAGYDIQITENGGYTAKGEKVFDLEGKEISYYAVLPFGMEKPEVQTRHNVAELKEGFLSAVCLHRLTNHE